MAVQFSVASDETIDVTALTPPLGLDEETLIWSSDEITNGAQHKGVAVSVEYHSIVPDAEVVSPVGLRILAIVEQKQDDGSWVEIGRQNEAVVKLSSQAPKRSIIVQPQALEEEGVDSVIQGFDGSESIRKSKFSDSAEDTLRICLLALDKTTSPSNPLQSVTFSVHGKRYDPS